MPRSGATGESISLLGLCDLFPTGGVGAGCSHRPKKAADKVISLAPGISRVKTKMATERSDNAS